MCSAHLGPLTWLVRLRIIRSRMNTTDAPLIVPVLERATHAVALWIDRSFQDPRLTQSEAHVLAYLALHVPCSINDLHRSFGHKRSTLTSLLDRLEGRGWTQRERNTHDQRSYSDVCHTARAGRQIP